MKRKAIVVGMIVSMCFVMTACGEEEGKTEGGKDGKTTITFQTWNPGEGAAIDEVIAAFEEKNPDIKINHVYMPYSDHMQKLKVDLASGGGQMFMECRRELPLQNLEISRWSWELMQKNSMAMIGVRIIKNLQ